MVDKNSKEIITGGVWHGRNINLMIRWWAVEAELII